MRAALLALLVAACGGDGPIRKVVDVDDCLLGSLRVLAIAGDQACTTQDPSGPSAPLEALAETPWTDAGDAASLTLEIPAQAGLTVVVQCGEQAGVVARWGCDDDRDDRLAVTLDDVCADACPEVDDPCGPDAVGWDGAGGAVCVPSCEACDDGVVDQDHDLFPADVDCDDDDPDVVPGSARPCTADCGDGTETCADGAWGPCVPPEAECAPGDLQTTPCDACGVQTSECEADCTWGPAGACGAGECDGVQTEACEAGCGTRTCTDCAWGACDAPCHCTGVIASGGADACIGEVYCVVNPRSCREHQAWECVHDETGCHWSRDCVSVCP